MKKLINSVEAVEEQMILGLVKSAPDKLQKLDCGNVVVRAQKKVDKVALVSGGGSNRMGGSMRGMGGKKGGRGAGFSLESLGIDGLVLGDDGSVSLTEEASEALLEQLRQFMPNTEVTVEQLRACATEQELMRLIGGANRGMGGDRSPSATPEAGE